MLPIVTFAHVAEGSAGEEISKEEANNRLAPSSAMLWTVPNCCSCTR